MRTTRFRSPLRRLATATVALGLFGAGVAPALADDTTVLTLDGPSHVTVAAEPEDGRPTPTRLEITVDNPAAKPESGTSYELYDYTVTFDTGDLSDVADVEVTVPSADNCETTGERIVCDYFGAPPGGSSIFARLSLTAVPGSDVGETGMLKVTAETRDSSFEQATFTDYTTRVTVGGADMLVKPLPQRHDAKPGDVWTPQLRFANGGSAYADGVSVILRATHGLKFAERFGNCAYSKPEDTPTSTIVYCRVSGKVEPLRIYTFAPTIDLKVTDAARMDDFTFAVYEDPVEALRTVTDEVTSFATFDGPELTLREVQARRSMVDPSPENNSTAVTVMTENTADFALTGDTAEGAKGDEVTVDVTFANHGPAWIAHLRSGGPSAVVDVRTPEGATVTGKPANCRGVTADGDYREKQLGAPRYLCELAYYVLEDTEKSLRFELRVDEKVADAEGTVSFLTEGHDGSDLGFDPNQANNTAALALNPTGDDGADGGTGTGGTDGEDDGRGSGDTDGATGGSGDTDGSGSDDGAGDDGADDTEGGLALTGGTGLYLTAGAAALALAGGATALYLVRRRRADGEDVADGPAAA